MVAPDEQQTVEAAVLKDSYPHAPDSQSLLTLHIELVASLELAQLPPMHALLAQIVSVTPHSVPSGWSVQKYRLSLDGQLSLEYVPHPEGQQTFEADALNDS